MSSHPTRRSCRIHGLSLALLTVVGITPVRADPLLPGAPLARVNLNQSNIILSEAGEPLEPIVSVTLPVRVVSGFLVLLENGASQDPTNWSDVVRFHLITTAGGILTGEAQLVSDLNVPGRGITDADLAPLGVTVAGVQGFPNTQYTPEVALGPIRPGLDGTVGTIYPAPNPTLPPGPPGTTATLTYFVFSEAPEPSTLMMGGTGLLFLLGYWRSRRRSLSAAPAY